MTNDKESMMERNILLLGYILLIAVHLLISGLKKLNSNGFYKEPQLISYCQGIISLVVSITQMGYEQNFSSLFVFYLLYGGIFIFSVYIIWNHTSITIYNISYNTLFKCLSDILSRHEIDFYEECKEKSLVEIGINNSNASIKISKAAFRKNTFNLSIKGFRKIPNYESIEADLEKYIFYVRDGRMTFRGTIETIIGSSLLFFIIWIIYQVQIGKAIEYTKWF